MHFWQRWILVDVGTARLMSTILSCSVQVIGDASRVVSLHPGMLDISCSGSLVCLAWSFAKENPSIHAGYVNITLYIFWIGRTRPGVILYSHDVQVDTDNHCMNPQSNCYTLK
jgi:hypothetical protein